ncbi:MAG: VWA domain-containing protein [Nitratireductor sp.]|nr:VWA domain-containing protein [Nitratireductor sp.]
MNITTNISSALRTACSSFRRDERGTFATIFGVTAVAVFLSAGVALDYTRLVQSKSVINSALDAAVLSAGNRMAQGEPVNADFRKDFENFFLANVEGRFGVPSNAHITSFTADPSSGKVSATASAEITMAFMGIAGSPTVTTASTSEAVFSNDAVEVAMMLDVTGSMGGQKIADLKEAAGDAVDILLPIKNTSGKTRISLVPYSSAVNAGPYAKKVSSNPSFACVTERGGSQKFTDAAPNSGKMGAASTYCPGQSVVPLSYDPAVLKSTIAGFQASGSTAGHLGVAWSYYTLSPSWKGVWPAKAKPANYKKTNSRKIAVLMTDGEFNTAYTSGWSSSAFAEEICKQMRKDGITIYSVGFDAPTQAQQTLTNCASTGSNGEKLFYAASNGTELKAAFRDIAISIQCLRLSK